MANDQDPMEQGESDIETPLTAADSESTASFFSEGLKNFAAESRGEKEPEKEKEDIDPVEPASKDEKKEKVVVDDNDDPKKKMKWGELKKRATDADVYEKEIVELKKKQEEYGVTQTKMEELQAKITEREEKLAAQEARLSIVDLESSESYQTSVAKPMNALMGNIRRLAETYQISVDDITAAIDKSDISVRNNLLTELSEGMNRRDQADFDKTTDGILSALEADAMLRANSREALETDKRKTAEASEQTKKQKQEAYQTAATKVWSTMEKKLSSLVDKKIVDEAKVSGDALSITDAPPDIQAGAAYALQLVPSLTKALETKNARIKELEANLANRSRSPSSVGAHPAAPNNDDDDEDDGLSVGERFARQQRGVRVG